MPTDTGRCDAGKDSGWFPMSQFHHVLKGFHRRKQHRQTSRLDSSEDDQASADIANERIGMLESRVHDLVEQLNKSRVNGSKDIHSKRVGRHEPIHVDASFGQADRTEAVKRKHVHATRRSMEYLDDGDESARCRGNSRLRPTGENGVSRNRALEPCVNKSRRGLVLPQLSTIFGL